MPNEKGANRHLKKGFKVNEMVRWPVVWCISLSLWSCGFEGRPIENYQQARQMFWNYLYPGNGKTLYCGLEFNGDQHAGVNVEHVFPMSWATKGLNCGTRKQCRANNRAFNLIEADLHNLYPARKDVNTARSSFRFGEVQGETRRFGRTCDFEVNRRARMAEPAPQVRGEVARAMFYMAYQYKDQGLVIFKKQAKMLHAWHGSDSPTADEKARNDAIESLQGNRNPFIDDPAMLDNLISSGYFF